MFHFTRPIAAAELDRILDEPITQWPQFIVKIADFGLAIQIRNSITRLTGTIGTSGTLIYMSPQQLNGMTPDVSDDIYSYGCVLYEMFQGEPPFVSGDIMYQIRNVIPPKIKNIDNDLQTLITSCLEKKAGLRPATFQAIQRRLNYDDHIVASHQVAVETVAGFDTVYDQDQMETNEITADTKLADEIMQPTWDEIAGDFEELKVKANTILKSDFQPENWSACDLYLDGKQKIADSHYDDAIPYLTDAFSEILTEKEKSNLGIVLLYEFVSINRSCFIVSGFQYTHSTSSNINQRRHFRKFQDTDEACTNASEKGHVR